LGDKAIVIGSDSGSEWQIPLWFYRYKQNNDIPVTICDFGMTPDAINFSKKHFIYKKIDVKLSSVWLLKPRCLVESGFYRVVWMDLDCLVFGNINPIFDFCSGFAVRKEVCRNQDFWGEYQCGVISTNSKNLLLLDWLIACEKTMPQL
jgi:hypothetical protein